ncbi:MAG: PTS cellobiose/arbutin/salicin transporter subunit IIBC [Turicibacter sp.]|nr:PTS cellobiose/arbutin/salicin transporter subunit IIBC [Turicibacter sp.]
MAKDFKGMAIEIVEHVGGDENIESVFHCMTRLRLNLKDDSKFDEGHIKKMTGVMGVVNQGGQFQIIVGNNVAALYKEVLQLGNFTPKEEGKKENGKLTFKKVGANILDAIVGTMSPLIPAIIGGSMIKLLLMIFNMTGIMDNTYTTFQILDAIGDGAFYFLPVLVAVSAAKKFNTNVFIAVAIAGAMIHPTYVSLMASAAEGTRISFLDIPITSVRYMYTVIPALVTTWVLSYIERWVDRITPVVTKNFLKPMLIMLLTAPIALILIGPLGIWVGTAISGGVFWVQDRLGFVAVAIMGGIWPLLVMTGMHRVFTPTIIQTIAETGSEGTVMPGQLGANLSLGGVSLAVAYKTKNKGLRQQALAAASSALIAGITEPALYGVAIRLKRPIVASLITGAICGAVAGIAGLASHSMAAPGLVTSIQFIDGERPETIFWIIGIMLLSIVLSFVLTLVLGFEDLEEEVE